MRLVARYLPRFIQDPLIERRWFRRMFGGHFERWRRVAVRHVTADVDAVRERSEWFPMMACTQASPEWNHLVRLRLPEFDAHLACEDHP